MEQKTPVDEQEDDGGGERGEQNNTYSRNGPAWQRLSTDLRRQEEPLAIRDFFVVESGAMVRCRGCGRRGRMPRVMTMHDMERGLCVGR